LMLMKLTPKSESYKIILSEQKTKYQISAYLDLFHIKR